jgi:hypothetical protein
MYICVCACVCVYVCMYVYLMLLNLCTFNIREVCSPPTQIIVYLEAVSSIVTLRTHRTLSLFLCAQIPHGGNHDTTVRLPYLCVGCLKLQGTNVDVPADRQIPELTGNRPRACRP